MGRTSPVRWPAGENLYFFAKRSNKRDLPQDTCTNRGGWKSKTASTSDARNQHDPPSRAQDRMYCKDRREMNYLTKQLGAISKLHWALPPNSSRQRRVGYGWSRL